jgi:hypothetical protein
VPKKQELLGVISASKLIPGMNPLWCRPGAKGSLPFSLLREPWRVLMTACYIAGDFKAYFIENMTDLGLSVPSNLFDSYQKALESAAFITAALKTLGSGATVSQLVGATFLPEKILGLASLGAAGYVGAVIGSIAVASGRSLGCGSRIADMFVFMHLHPELKFEGGEQFYMWHPEVVDRGNKRRQIFAHRLRTSPKYFEHAA